MASKKTGKAAGLAALAGLAYMATKDKGAKDTAAENNRIADARAAREEQKGPASKPFDEAKKPFKDAMFEKEPGPYLTDDKAMYEKEPGFETKTTPDKVASASSPASKPAQTGRFAPSGSPVLSDNPRKIGNAKAVVAPGGDRSARLDMPKAGKTGNAKAVVAPGGDRSARSDMVSAGPTPARAPGGVGKRGGVGDGGQSMVERQNAGAKRAGLSVDDYITSGKKTIDEQDGTFKRGGAVKKMASGGMTSSASKRGDGIATKGKTRGRMC